MSTFDWLYKLPMSRSGDRALRFPLSSAVAIIGDNARVLYECRGINISRTGLLMEYRGANQLGFKINDMLHIIIEPDPRYFKFEIKISARVARVIKTPDGQQIGLDFTADSGYRGTNQK